MNRPLVAAVATTVVIVVVAVMAVVYPWSRIAGAIDHEPIVGEVPAGQVASGNAALDYVALGSSYAAGPDSTSLISIRCLRSGDDYPHQVAAAWRMKLTDVTCSGSTIPDILSRAQRGRAEAPQIDAVTADTDLVTITTGGNDVGYIGRLTGISCANWVARGNEAGHRCSATRSRTPPTPADFARLREGLIDIVEAVRARAPHAVVMIVNYPPVLDARATTCPTVPLTPAEAITTVQTFDGLTVATRAAAEATDAILVDATTPGTEHTACSSSPWVYGYRMPAPYHPTAEGRDAMARLTIDAIEASGLVGSTMPK